MVSENNRIEILIGKEFPKKVIPLLNEAQKSIDIIVFDWRWYKEKPGSATQLFNQSIVRSIRRGVCVRAITNTNQIIEILKGVGIKAKTLDTPRLVHVKMMIIDDNIVIVGSHNYTESAFQLNFELSVVLRDPESNNKFKTFFNQLYV